MKKTQIISCFANLRAMCPFSLVSFWIYPFVERIEFILYAFCLTDIFTHLAPSYLWFWVIHHESFMHTQYTTSVRQSNCSRWGEDRLAVRRHLLRCRQPTQHGHRYVSRLKGEGASTDEEETILPLFCVAMYHPNSVHDEECRPNNDDHTRNGNPYLARSSQRCCHWIQHAEPVQRPQHRLSVPYKRHQLPKIYNTSGKRATTEPSLNIRKPRIPIQAPPLRRIKEKYAGGNRQV